MNKEIIKGHIFAIICVFIWGTTFVSTKILLQYLTPIEILFIRFSIGFLALSAFSVKKLKVTKKSHEIYFMGAGLCGVTLYFLFENIALTYTFASNVAIILSVAPFFTAMVSTVFLKEEKLSKSFFVGLGFALVGITIISFNGSTNLELNPLGDILAIIAAFTWACYCVITKQISAFGYNTIKTTQKSFFYGLIFMIPAIIVMGFSSPIEILFRPEIIYNILFLGLGASAACFILWNLSLKYIGAVKTSTYIYASPVVTVIFSYIFLSEPITKATVIGSLLTITGLVISEYRKAKPSI